MFYGCSNIQYPVEGSSNVAVLQYDRQKTISLKLANYRFQKKYDILEKSLFEEYKNKQKKKHIFGQLYSVLNLADFYNYGFINFKKSLDYYEQADEINNFINKSGLKEDKDKNNKKITYYKIEGKAPSIKYDYDEILNYIRKNKNQIHRILSGYSFDSSDIIISDKKPIFPEILFLETDRYENVLQISKDLINPEIFSDFEKELFNKAEAYFKKFDEISQNEKIYYINYNVARCLLNTFDIFEISLSQTNHILNYIDLVFESKKNELTPKRLYLEFCRIICLNKLDKYKEAIEIFEKFQKDVKAIQEIMTNYMKGLKESKNRSLLKSTVELPLFLGIDLFLLNQINYSPNISRFAISDLPGNFPIIQRELKFIGESDYSKDINIILNIDEQLQLFRAIGNCYYHLNNFEKSIFYNKEAIDIINSLRSTISYEKGRINFEKYKDGIYNNLIDSLIIEKETEMAFYYSENSRSRALVDLLGSKKDIVLKNNETNEYVNHLKNIQISNDFMRKVIGKTDEQVKYINQLKSTLYEKIDYKNKSISFDKEVLSLITVCNLEVNEISSLLPDGYSLIEYYISQDKIYVWIIDKTDIDFYCLNIKPEILKKYLNSFSEIISRPYL
ncbi:MAG: hypothetical protein ACFFDN_03520, partial [Candidatus Hodarchaeota archaeon]